MSEKLRVMFLAETWGSSKDDLSMINREIAKHFVTCPSIGQVTVFVPPGQDSKAKEDALKCGVDLIEAQATPGMPPSQLLCFPPEHLQIDVVVGYGRNLGPQAQRIRDSKKCIWVQVVHVSSEELGMHKGCREYEKKHVDEIALCAEADLVVAIGPKLVDTYTLSLRYCSKDVQELTPGIFEELTKLKPAGKDGRTFRILAFGRGTLEDFEVKGYDIAARTVGGMPQGRYHLIFVGAPEGQQEDVKKIFLMHGIKRDQLIVRSFLETREQLPRMFCEADLCIMPSRTEGFGLTALEALSAGVPILVAKNSGIGAALGEVLHGNACIVESDEPEDWRKRIEGVLGRDRSLRLMEADGIRNNYKTKYSWAKQCGQLVEKICSLKQQVVAQASSTSSKSSGKAGKSTKREAVDVAQTSCTSNKIRKLSGEVDKKTKSSTKDIEDGGVTAQGYFCQPSPLIPPKERNMKHLNGEPTDVELIDLSKKLSCNWQSLGPRLGVDQDKMKSILRNNEYPSPELKAQAVLMAWKDKDESFTNGKLAKALREEGLGRLAKQFCVA